MFQGEMTEYAKKLKMAEVFYCRKVESEVFAESNWTVVKAEMLIQQDLLKRTRDGCQVQVKQSAKEKDTLVQLRDKAARCEAELDSVSETRKHAKEAAANVEVVQLQIK